VSSDPVLAFLLDEVVIKDWCKKAVNALISDIGMICILQRSINFISSCMLYFFNSVSPFMHPLVMHIEGEVLLNLSSKTLTIS
jgi:hypothetical protein